MNDYMLVQMRIAELTDKARQARLARQAGSSGGAPGGRLARWPAPAAAMWWRWRTTVGRTGRASDRLGGWTPVNDAQARRAR